MTYRTSITQAPAAAGRRERLEVRDRELAAELGDVAAGLDGASPTFAARAAVAWSRVWLAAVELDRLADDVAREELGRG